MIDWSKPIQTTDGRPARVLCTDRKWALPCLVLVKEKSGEEGAYVAKLSGEGSYQTRFENVPERSEPYRRFLYRPLGQPHACVGISLPTQFKYVEDLETFVRWLDDDWKTEVV